MNSFFASAEQHLRPELRGRPVGVIPVETERTCVIAASVEAKRAGVKTGTGAPDARRLCPGIVLVKARPAVYVELHHAVAESIETVLPLHRAYSIDEWAIRLRGPEREPDRALALARSIKDTMRAAFSPCLSCSVGVAPTRLLAKIACDLEKPDGLVWIGPGDMPARIAHLALDDLCGISTGVRTRLSAHGVEDVRGLWALSKAQSVRIWGSVEGGRWWAGFHGVDEPEIPTRRRSMSHANVLDPKFRTPDGARRMLMRLAQRLCVRLRYEDRACSGVWFAAYGQGPGESAEASASFPETQNSVTIVRTLHDLWDRQRIRFNPFRLTITLGGLVPRTGATGSLFEQDEKETRLSRTLDAINMRWGAAAAYFGSMHGCCQPMDNKIAFGRIPPTALRVLAGEGGELARANGDGASSEAGDKTEDDAFSERALSERGARATRFPASADTTERD